MVQQSLQFSGTFYQGFMKFSVDHRWLILAFAKAKFKPYSLTAWLVFLLTFS